MLEATVIWHSNIGVLLAFHYLLCVIEWYSVMCLLFKYPNYANKHIVNIHLFNLLFFKQTVIYIFFKYHVLKWFDNHIKLGWVYTTSKGIASLLKMEFPYITVVLGLSFKGLDKTLHPIIGASYFVWIGPREKPVNPSKGIGFTQPVTGIAILPTIGNIVKYNCNGNNVINELFFIYYNCNGNSVINQLFLIYYCFF